MNVPIRPCDRSPKREKPYFSGECLFSRGGEKLAEVSNGAFVFLRLDYNHLSTSETRLLIARLNEILAKRSPR